LIVLRGYYLIALLVMYMYLAATKMGYLMRWYHDFKVALSRYLVAPRELVR
jgi:hypothetical protein